MVFVVERYLPGLSRSDLLRGLARLEQAIEELRGESRAVRYLGSTIVLGDEACFCQFEGPSEADVAEVNRRAGLSFDRIVPAITVGQSERRGQMTIQETIPRPRRLRLTWPFLVGAAVLAVGVAAALFAVSLGTGGDTTASGSDAISYVDGIASLSPDQREAAFGTSGAKTALSPSERRYMEGLASLSSGQLMAAFGTVDLSPKEEQYVRAISSMTQGQLTAAFGTADATTVLSPSENLYVNGIASLSPAQVTAAFGTAGAPMVLSPRERRYMEGLASLGPDFVAAFSAALGLSPKEEQYVRAISSMTPTQLAAAFGTGH